MAKMNGFEIFTSVENGSKKYEVKYPMMVAVNYLKQKHGFKSVKQLFNKANVSDVLIAKDMTMSHLCLKFGDTRYRVGQDGELAIWDDDLEDYEVLGTVSVA